MPDIETARGWKNRKLIDNQGGRIGTITDLYLDIRSGRPEWAVVHTGLLGARSSIVPLADAVPEGEQVRVPYDKEQVKSAPNIAADEELSETEEAELYRHYGLEPGRPMGQAGTAAGAAAGTAAAGTAAAGRGAQAREAVTEPSQTGMGEGRGARATPEGTQTGVRPGEAPPAEMPARPSGAEAPGRAVGREAPSARGRTAEAPEMGRADTAMTRSEEELVIRTEVRDLGHARLRKYIVVERESRTVPLRHEELRMDREPITEANREAAMAGPDLREAEHDVVLHGEDAIVEKRVVPKERVRIYTETVTDQRQVQADLRKERIELEEPDAEAQRRSRGQGR
jgi:uncharacterized protein (TIGR02271 family)